MTTKIPLIAYRRVSTARQLDGYGLPAQEADLRAYVRGSDYRLVRIETDEARSGTLPADERPGLLAALKAIKSGEAAGLLIPGDLDRLARELIVQEAILSQVWKAGGSVHTTTRGEILADDPDDPMRTAIRQFMGVIAQLERALTIKRLRNGQKAKAAAGGYAGYGSPAFGKQSVSGTLVTDAREAAVIGRIHELRSAGLSFRRIAATLNEEGLQAKRGGPWHQQTVARVRGTARPGQLKAWGS